MQKENAKIPLQPLPNSSFGGVLSLNFIIIASLLHLQGCIDFRGGLINLLFAAGPLLSQECRYLLITPFGNGKLMKEATL